MCLNLVLWLVLFDKGKGGQRYTFFCNTKSISPFYFHLIRLIRLIRCLNKLLSQLQCLRQQSLAPVNSKQ